MAASLIRAQVVQIAQSQVGVRDPAKYFADAAPCYKPKDYASKSWCRIFALWVYRQADLTDLHWVDELGFESALPSIPRSKVLPGDMTILERNLYGQEVWHGAIVVGTEGKFIDHTVDGNTANGVDAIERDIRLYTPRPTYKSIQPWVDLYEATHQQHRAAGLAIGAALTAAIVAVLTRAFRHG